MASTDLTFSSRDEHRAWLASQGAMPRGFRVGASKLEFAPYELPQKVAKMSLTLIALDEPTPDFAAVFTNNALPGAPIKLGRRRLDEPVLSAVLVNNKISNVCAPGGEETSERLCDALGKLLGVPGRSILPSSTGVIGWRLPLEAMLSALPTAVASLRTDSALTAAAGIVTTDLYPKLRSAELLGGRIVGIAKGAGMIEPNLATMLVYLFTDLAVPRDVLRAVLRRVVEPTFNSMSIDSDTSTSDTVALISSGKVPCPDVAAFEAALLRVCQDLTEDIVRNGEGVHHVLRVEVSGAPNEALARGVGKAVVNAPLFKCAVAGNDPNVGRLVQAVGKYLGATSPGLDLSKLRMSLGGIPIVENALFFLEPSKEADLVGHLKSAELYASRAAADGTFVPPVDFPAHERAVQVHIDLGLGEARAVVLGADLTHEYVSENADYRS
jgi:glutamate N-acetyltransferase/amino-acid N-acetyltransferase